MKWHRLVLLAAAAAGGCHLIGGIDAAEPQCSIDGVKNGLEVDVDCGGPCGKCQDLKACANHEDCASNACYDGICEPPSCDDDRKNGYESDVDCGGDPPCPRCWGDESCNFDDDCARDADPNLSVPPCQDGFCIPACCGEDCGDECETCPRECPAKQLGQPCDPAVEDSCNYPLLCLDDGCY